MAGRKTGKTKSKRAKAEPSATKSTGGRGNAPFPRHTAKKALRIPKAILDQNAGKPCTDEESAGFSGVGYHGPFQVELGSSLKYGFLARPQPGSVEVTDLGKQALRPKNDTDETEALRQALLNAPNFSEVYKHYRGENLPDEPFFGNALTDTFHIPEDKRDEFKAVFLENLTDAKLIEKHADKARIVDVSTGGGGVGVQTDSDQTLARLGKSAKIESGDSCFVMMPFAEPIGAYYKTIYEPAITKAGLRAVRADDDMFSTGKIIDQIWAGVNAARILVAELTGKNANVFYELGLAHALGKPVVLIFSNESDVPFDIHHVRVIYYDVRDPF